MSSVPAADPGFEIDGCGADHCITCGDDGVPMTVAQIDVQRDLALCVDSDGVRSTVEIALVDPVLPGDELLVHAGTAIAVLASAGEERR